MTNREYIESLSDEELAIVLYNGLDSFKDPDYYLTSIEYFPSWNELRGMSCLAKWLCEERA